VVRGQGLEVLVSGGNRRRRRRMSRQFSLKVCRSVSQACVCCVEVKLLVFEAALNLK
jgi:hypothetical protein